MKLNVLGTELALINKTVLWEAQLVGTDYVDVHCLHIVLKLRTVTNDLYE